ncbi:hypothetical protein PVAND_007343 [Polypedilum vanderplanki]|uniref:HEAT repeat-containing protein 1 n=1 Tax=Polypedilum vanderplanki TaxID=319348 RepID=A0A9J6C6P7_POLVA|nr:hypothetical protein PVAND_007343 [Polypedilum vanderplanki]
MSTSLREQLLRLQTPQASQFVDKKKRDSILFSSKDAATKSRETIYEIGISGLRELIEIDDSLTEFENTLFNFTAKDVQRAVETKEVNKLLDKNIRRFMYHLSPYFMIPSSHKCLEWLIRRFNINLYNREEMLMLILPYHQTNMFVRCVQTMKFTDSNDKWNFFNEVKKSSSPLSKITLWNHGVSQPSFLDFVGKFTYNAVKELGHNAGKLQTMISFYFTTIAGTLEQATKINDNHILGAARYLNHTYNSSIIDYTSAGYMITAQLVAKARLSTEILYMIMNKMTETIPLKLSRECLLLLALIFQTQSETLVISDKTLENLLAFDRFLFALKEIMREDKIKTEFYRALIYKLLVKLQDKNVDFNKYCDICEKILYEVDMDDELARVIIRTVLDSYIQEDSEPQPIQEKSSQDESEIILLDSDDEENIPLKSQNVTKWYSMLLKKLERQYPLAFDLVVKDIMTRNPQRKRNGLKNVLGFLMNVSCSNNDTDIFENLYHHNFQVRSKAVSYLVKNFHKIELTPENEQILKLTLTERLNDESVEVVAEILKMNLNFLIKIIGVDELIAKLTKIIMKYWRNSEKWEKNASSALKFLITLCENNDSNIALFSILPFMFECNTNAKPFAFENNSKIVSNINEMLEDHAKVPSSESLLSTIQNVLINNHHLGSFSENFAFYLLSNSFTATTKDPEFSIEAFQIIQTITSSANVKFNQMDISDVNIMKRNEISIKILSQVLIALIDATKFTIQDINFSNQNTEMKLIFKIFKFTIDLFFKVDPSYRENVNTLMIGLLEKVCASDETKKLNFFSQFCVMHAAICNNNMLEFQARTMGLLNHVLKSGQMKEKDYSNEMYQNILISLSSPITKIREFGMELISTLVDKNISGKWKFLLDKLSERKDEILMDCEQIPMIIYLLTNKKSSKNMQEIIESILVRIADDKTFDYIQSELLKILKYFNDQKVLDISIQIATKIIDEFNSENFYLNESYATIIKLVLMKFNQETVSNLWNLALKSLKCHYIMNDDGKIITPSILVLQSIDNELFYKLHPNHKMQIFEAIIECSMNEQARIVQAAQKVFFEINIDYKLIQNVLLKFPKCLNISDRMALSYEWKFGITLLELLQNKSEGTDGHHELLPVLFEILSTCLNSGDQSEIEYLKQIILSLILSICKKISPDGRKQQKFININDSTFKTDLIIKCIKESQNPQTHHHSLLLLAHLALMIPEQVLRDITTIFTFVGTALVRHDDSYSFQIITKIIENVIPNLLKNNNDKEVISILRTFATIALDVPVHRRMMLYVKLLDTLGAEKYLWMFIALLLETQVKQPKTKEEDLPPRLQVALAISKEFDLKTVIVSTTSLVIYLKELPLTIDINKQYIHTTIEDDIFPLETHTNKNMRHFKYLITLFIKHILESPEISNKTYQMNIEQVHAMKTHFQNLILNTLIWLPDVNKLIEMKQNEVYWQLILQIYFDILEATIALLAPDMLLIVVERLIEHDNLIVRKKVIELLNRKLEDDYFKSCANEKILKMMEPLKNVCERIGANDLLSHEESVQQLALVSIKLLSRKLSEDYPDQFIECLNHLTAVINCKTLRKTTTINLIDCVAELLSDLKVYGISLLGKFLPNLINLLVLPESPSYNLLYSVTSSLLKIVEAVPLFMSPYLVQIISQLIKIAPQLKTIQDTKISYIVQKIKKIWESMSQMIPLRVLYPSIDEIYDSINQKQQFNSVAPLMEFMHEIFKHVETKDIRDFQAELTEFFLKIIRFRCEATKTNNMQFNEINDIEGSIMRALISLILKLSEGSFRPLFENITNWAIKDKEDDDNRLITFFRITTEVSAALKSLFLLFASDVVDSASQLLDKCNSSKENEEGLCFGNDTEKNLYLIENILQTLENMFLNDHQNFINSRRFDIIMQPIVDQIENEDALKCEKIQELIRKCIAQLAVAISDDILWKQLNYQVLLKTRSDNPEIRIFGVKVCVDIARKLTEDFESLIPETIPFLSELLEDDDHKVVEACQNSVRELETICNSLFNIHQYKITIKMNICDLPDHILEKIFLEIDYDEIFDLTSVCSRFNEVISSSYQLMSSFTVQWKKSMSKQVDLRPLLSSERKYQRIQIEDIVGIKPNLDKFITKHANTLSEVNLFECSFKSSEISAALEVLKDNLHLIGMCEVNFEVDSKIVPIQFKKLNYMEIMYGYGDGYCSIFNMFTGCKTVKNLTYEDNFEVTIAEAQEFSHFLSSLSGLEYLSLSYNVAQKIFLDEDFNQAVQFHLKKLFVSMNPPAHRPSTKAKRIAYEHLLNFLNKQSSSLKDLSVTHSKLTTDRLEFLLSLNVEKLGLVACDFVHRRKIFVKNSTIKTLFISLNDDEIEENSEEESAVCELIKMCENVKHVHFTCAELNFEIGLAIRNSKSKIEKLTMYRCSFFPMNIPTLKYLDVGGLIDHEEIISLIRLNPQLEELHGPGCLRHFQKFAQAIDELSSLKKLILM